MPTSFKIAAGFIFFTALIFGPRITHAETHITSNDLLHGGTWDKEGSPYILDEPTYIPGGFSLRIKRGVTVMSASSTEPDSEPNSLTFDGDFTIEGTADEPVHIYDMDSIYFSHSNSNIRHAVLHKTGLSFYQSTSTISDTTISESETGISAEGSIISIDHSKIIKNNIGIGSYMFFKGPVLMRQGNSLVKNDFADPEQNTITIHNSSISENSEYEILQHSTNLIDATDNWWGSANGPGEKVYGPIETSPWLDQDPFSDTCCSNVIFIPGIEASRLYKDSPGILGTSTNQLWEPNRNDDVRKMYMNAQGKSIDPSIYTSDIIDSAFGLKPIYKSFIAMMNSVVADKNINVWLPLAYDWRMNAEEIVIQGNLVKKVEDLAQNSKTGKVIMVAHSNGGLIGKALMDALGKKGKSDLIEKVVNVAVPELGTPQALLGLLHGHNQSILGGLILTKNNARIFGRNLPGAYSLLPSQRFFDRNPMKVISNLFTNDLSGTSYATMKNFLLSNSFSKSSTTDTNVPLLLNSALISDADSIHSIIDLFRPASTTETLSIFGWGLPTSQGIEYEKDKHCTQVQIRTSTCPVAFSPLLTDDGDGTVVTKANSGNADSTLYFNLKKLNKDTEENINHANILESENLLDKIKDTITDTVSPEPSYEEYFSSAEPINTDKYLTVKVYSPVDIHIYDKEGNHTGILENPVAGKDLESFENNIPSSYYGDFGRIKMVRVPYDTEYQIVLEGNDTGVFSLDAEITQSDKVIASTTFAEMPVTVATNIELVVGTSTQSFATSTVMNIDSDGDGITEYTQNSEEFLKKNPGLKKIHKKFIKIIKKLTKKRLLKHIRK